MCNVVGHSCSGTYASNISCMYTSATGHIPDCSGFIRGTYCKRCLISVPEVVGIFAYICHFRDIFVLGTYIAVAW